MAPSVSFTLKKSPFVPDAGVNSDSVLSVARKRHRPVKFAETSHAPRR